ncbi:hypothetical protein OROHE_021569 [Orobanche hederae]
MGWLWKDEDSGYISSSSSNDNSHRCATRKVVSSECRTEEVKPGKFIRKCEKTEQSFKDCVGSFSHNVLRLTAAKGAPQATGAQDRPSSPKASDVWELRALWPSEMVESNKEYTEEDVTDQMVKGSSRLEFGGNISSYFPGLRSDIEAIERDLFGGMNRFLEAAEDIKNEFFSSVGAQHISDKDGSSSQKRGVHTEDAPGQEALPKNSLDGDVDISGLAIDI